LSRQSDIQSSICQAATSGTDAPWLDGAVSGVAKLKQKIKEIEWEWNAFKVEHTKLEYAVGNITSSLVKLSD
jgi:hypothetical protein